MENKELKSLKRMRDELDQLIKNYEKDDIDLNSFETLKEVIKYLSVNVLNGTVDPKIIYDEMIKRDCQVGIGGSSTPVSSISSRLGDLYKSGFFKRRNKIRNYFEYYI